MTSSTQNVLGTPELLENILLHLHLHLRTLLTAAQLVSRHWHTTIANSPALQQVLFFRPYPAHPSSSPSTADKEQQLHPHPEVNPLLVTAFAMFFDGSLFKRDTFELLPFAHGNKASCHDAFMQVGASWRRMLTCQPPVMRLGIWYREGRQRSLPLRGPRNPSAFWDETFSSEEEKWPELGLRMGTLYDMVIDSLCKHERCSIVLYWDIERDFAPREEGPEEEEERRRGGTWRRSKEYVNVHNGEKDWKDWWDHPETVQQLSKVARTVNAVMMTYVKPTYLIGFRPPPDKRFEQRYTFPAAKTGTLSAPG